MITPALVDRFLEGVRGQALREGNPTGAHLRLSDWTHNGLRSPERANNDSTPVNPCLRRRPILLRTQPPRFPLSPVGRGPDAIDPLDAARLGRKP